MTRKTPPQPTPEATTPAANGAKTPPPQPRQFGTIGEKDAWLIDTLVVPGRLQTLLADAGVGADGVRLFLERFVANAIERPDPMEQLIVEQLVFLHHRILRLHVEAAAEESVESAKLINGAAARLTGELRKLILALKAYRAPTVTKSATFIKMQAVAERQDVRYVDQSSPGKTEERIVIAGHNEVEDKPGTGAPDAAAPDPTDQKPETRSRWQDQRLQEAAVD